MALGADTHDAGQSVSHRSSASDLLSDVGAPEELVAVSDEGTAYPWRRLLVGLLMTCLVTAALVGAVNVAVDPTGLWGNNAVYDHPTDLTMKSRLIARGQPFHTLVLGSSRAYRIDPVRVRALTGHSAFNGAISGGTIGLFKTMFDRALRADGKDLRSVIFLLDEDKFRSAPARETLRVKLEETFSFNTLVSSVRFVQSHITSADPSPYRSDGFQRTDRAVHTSEAAVPGGLPEGKGVNPGPWGGYDNPSRRRPFEAFLKTANDRGIRPVVVLTPLHPDVFRSAGIRWRRAHTAFVRYAFSLQRRFSLIVIDASRVSSFGGSADGFIDGVHMDVPQSQMLLRLVAKRAASAL